uniref:Uncharacterized protein n=1 Tax=Myotis myotis TaxID=51298 RepID=A0A7J7RSM8_MYOMY|nr:hypothetical protein mMyoMyo1_010182 [Myotis myotis]
MDRLPPARPPLGIEPATRACALTGNRTLTSWLTGRCPTTEHTGCARPSLNVQRAWIRSASRGSGQRVHEALKPWGAPGSPGSLALAVDLAAGLAMSSSQAGGEGARRSALPLAHRGLAWRLLLGNRLRVPPGEGPVSSLCLALTVFSAALMKGSVFPRLPQKTATVVMGMTTPTHPACDGIYVTCDTLPAGTLPGPAISGNHTGTSA